MKVIIIRHGKTQSNIERRYMGCRTDEDLLETEKLSLQDPCIADDDILIISSPMKRSLQTAHIFFPGKEVLVADDLREMDFGIFEGKNYMDLSGDPDYQAWVDSGCTSRIPGGESMDSFIKRTMTGFREAVRTAIDKRAATLCIVAHGGSIMSVMYSLFGGNYYDYYTQNGDGYIFRLEVDDAGDFAAAGTYDSFCGRVRP